MRQTEQLIHFIENNSLIPTRKAIIDGADVNKLIILTEGNHREYLTPLKLAIQNKNVSIIELLINHDAHVLNTKKLLNRSDCKFLDDVLSELMIEELAKVPINVRKVQTFLNIGASINYSENPLWTLCINARLSESERLMIFELLLEHEKPQPHIVEKLMTHPRWVMSLSTILFNHIQLDAEIEKISYFIRLGAQIDLPLPYESSLMFLFDEEINKMETASEKANRLGCGEIVAVMTGPSTRRSFSM